MHQLSPSEADRLTLQMTALTTNGQQLYDPVVLGAGGRRCSLGNSLTRGRRWKLTYVASNFSNGNMAVGDERGQVFYLNLESNAYQLIRLASNSGAVISIDFLHYHRRSDQILVSFSSGELEMIDCSTRISLSVDSLRPFLIPAQDGRRCFRSIQCHPRGSMTFDIYTI